jgi:hypothetical protein
MKTWTEDRDRQIDRSVTWKRIASREKSATEIGRERNITCDGWIEKERDIETRKDRERREVRKTERKRDRDREKE